MNLQKYISDIDTARFGFKIARINDFDIEPSLLVPALKEFDVKLIITRLSLVQIHLINQLERLGFEIKDTQVKYIFYLEKDKLPEIPVSKENLIIKDFVKEDADKIITMAKKSFTGYGHYNNNPYLKKNVVEEIYSDWVSETIKEGSKLADKILVASYNGEPAGFYAIKIEQDQHIRQATSVIAFVDEQFRNLNIMKLLMHRMVAWCREQNLTLMEHYVLLTNLPMNKIHTKLGFSIADSYVTMHHWIENDQNMA